MNQIVAALGMLALPILVFFGGAEIMNRLSHRQPAREKPLNRRFHYDIGDVQRVWGAFDRAGLRAELRVLELDLVFPFLYGGALAASLLLAWNALGRPFAALLIVAPVGITLLADWTENLVQMQQLRRFLDGAALEEPRIRIASAATAVKLTFFYASWLGLFTLVSLLFVRVLR